MFTMYNHLRDLARAHGMSPSRMMLESGVSKTAFSNLRSKPDGTISPETARKIADYLKVSVDEVMGREKKEPALPDKLNPDYLKLNDVNRAAIDAAIAELLKGQKSSD